MLHLNSDNIVSEAINAQLNFAEKLRKKNENVH